MPKEDYKLEDFGIDDNEIGNFEGTSQYLFRLKRFKSHNEAQTWINEMDERDRLANEMFNQWSSWMRYILFKVKRDHQGNLFLTKQFVKNLEIGSNYPLEDLDYNKELFYLNETIILFAGLDLKQHKTLQRYLHTVSTDHVNYLLSTECFEDKNGDYRIVNIQDTLKDVFAKFKQLRNEFKKEFYKVAAKMITIIRNNGVN